MTDSIVLHDLGFAWPDGTEVLRGLDATIPIGRIGLVGDNGSGKTTLARLIAGELDPGIGSISGAAGAVRIDQLLPASDSTVASALGIGDRLASLRRVLGGTVDESDLDMIGDDWGLEEDALAALATTGLGFDGGDLDRSVGDLSGGEAMRVGLARAALAGPEWLVLDEPSNNLDRAGRESLASLLEDRRGPTLVISHDVDLLESMDAIADLADGLRIYGGGYSAFAEAVAIEEAVRVRAVVESKKVWRIERDQRVRLETVLARADRKAAKDYANKRRPKRIMNNLTDFAEKSAARRRGEKADDEQRAKDDWQAARDAGRRRIPVALRLPETEVRPGARVLGIGREPGARIDGPARVRLTGANGSGKSTLLAAIGAAGELPTAAADAGRAARLFPDLEIAVHGGDLDIDPHRVHETLAALGLRAGRADDACAQLSGGERARVALAAAVLSRPAPRLLVLDEPSNDIDLASRQALVTALTGFTGGVLLVTHDDAFARDLGVVEEWDIASFT